MNLNTTQLQTLKTWLDANAASLNDLEAANALNVQASPDFWVFKTSVPTDKARESVDWNEVLTGSPLSALKQWAFDTLLANGDFNPALENERVGFTTIFSGAAYANTRTNLLNASTRLATVGEKVLSTVGTGPGGGDGSAQNASAILGVFTDANGDRVWAEGNVTSQNVVDARSL